MHLFFEDDGSFKAGHVLEASGASDASAYQVELGTGRRVKIKAASVLLRFEQPSPTELMHQAQILAETVDLDFLWEVAPQEEFEVSTLGADYFGSAPSAVQQAALLLRVHGAPMYFRRRGKGRYKPATEVELKAALAGQERKRKLAEWQAAVIESLKAGQLPTLNSEGQASDWAARAPWLLFKPDRQSAEGQAEQKAIEQAAHETQMSAPRLFMRAGAFANVMQLHRARFLVEWFPAMLTGKSTPAPPAPPIAIDKLPLAPVQAFSIDDSQTTEIDDALSVSWPDAGLPTRVRVGVHIAAPGVAMRPGDALDALARKRLSTVYMPGEKITMLPDEVVQTYTLGAGQARAAVSLYADFDLETGECLATESRLERVPIVANLRHDELDTFVTEESLAPGALADYPFHRELQILWTLTGHLAAVRDEARGKPEPRNRTDFNFRVDMVDGVEKVRIEQRRRDAPLDRIVAEWMIFANSSWGRRLADAGVPGIYRTQTSFGRPGVKQSSVRMTTVPDRHIGMGVSHYAWSSSPLRRYVDLVNQWQLLSVLQLQRPPFEKGSSELFATIGAFDAAYGAYAEIQNTMERYWCLRWLVQEARVGSRMPAVMLRNEMARLAELPLVARLAGSGHLAPGTHVEVDIISIDEIDLIVELRLGAVHVEEPVEEIDDAEAEEIAGDGVGGVDAVPVPEISVDEGGPTVETTVTVAESGETEASAPPAIL
jgi:exoribonuclease-2